MPKIPELIEMLKAGMHFGHRVSKWHPGMKKYIFAARNGVHILDLEKTAEELGKALEFVAEIVASGGQIIFVGTKRQTKKIVEQYAQKVKTPYVTERWIGGTFTNFPVVLKVIRKLKTLEKKRQSGELEKYTKKERLKFDQEIEDLEKKIGGLRDLEKLPEAIFIVDVHKGKTALKEAVRKGISIIAIVDTNINPKNINYPIPANDDAIKSVEMITSLVAQAIEEGREKRKKKMAEKDIKEKKIE